MKMFLFVLSSSQISKKKGKKNGFSSPTYLKHCKYSAVPAGLARVALCAEREELRTHARVEEVHRA